MKTKLFLVLMFFSFFLSNESLSQDYTFSSKNKKALKYYSEAEVAFMQGELKAAETYLQQTINIDPEFIEAWLLLGDVSSELGKTDEAIDAYQKSVAIDPEFFPPVYYFLGNLYYSNGQYEEAVNEYKKFLSDQQTSKEQSALAASGLKKSVFALTAVQHPKLSVPKNLGLEINTTSDEYINFVNEDLSELIFTRKILVNSDKAGNQLFRESIFTSDKVEKKWEEAKELPLAWQQGLDIGGMNLAVDGRKMYFTGCNWPSNYGSCDLFVSYKKGNNWELPFHLGNDVNSQSWDSQPAISSDGRKMYFASKRAGGKGGSDIWMTIMLSNGRWSKPINLGDSINSAGDEMSPFIHADGKTLYFSSNGHLGLGGFDLFVSKQDETGIWSSAKNLGYPINSKANEVNIFLSIDGQTAWISSDRKGGEGGFDIYSFPTYETMRPQPVFYVKGIVSDAKTGKKLAAKVEIANLRNAVVVDSVNADSVNGEFLMVLHPGNDYAFTISKKSYLFYSENFNLKDTTDNNFVSKEFKLSPIQRGNSFVLNNIFFDFNSSTIQVSSHSELDKLAQFLSENTELNILIVGHTDSIGSMEYNQLLSIGRAESVYQYLISKGINASRMNFTGYGDTNPVDTNETEEGRARNRRTEIVIL